MEERTRNNDINVCIVRILEQTEFQLFHSTHTPISISSNSSLSADALEAPQLGVLMNYRSV
jgi:hypothetical protein